MNLSYKVYEYPQTRFKAYYITLNGRQIGGILFLITEVKQFLQKADK